jgi:hypothetical protein
VILGKQFSVIRLHKLPATAFVPLSFVPPTGGAAVNNRDFYLVSSETKDCQNFSIISDEKRPA